MAYAGFQFFCVVLLVVKSSSKKVQITSLMHIAVAPSDGNGNDYSDADPRSWPASRCDVSDLQLCCARLHLGGCTSFGLMDPAANAGTTTMTTCNKNVASFALTRKKFSYVCADRELKEAKKSREKMSSASSSFSDVFRYARCCNIVAWEWIARLAKLQSSPLPESDLTHSFIHSLTHEHSIEYFN